MSLSGSGIKEMSSSNIGKSHAGGKEGFMYGSTGGGFELKEPKISFEHMDINTKKKCFELAKSVFMLSVKGELKYFKNMAEIIKNKLDENEEVKCWHVVVGRNFGAFVGFEKAKIIMFWINHIGFLIWKHG